jgi:dihydrolipoamide dehydrogenase
MFSRAKASLNYQAMPKIIFINPGIASVGISETDCKKHKQSIKTAIAPLNIIARSNTSDFSDGFVKIIVNNKGVIIGASVVAPGAAEIIQELVLAVHYQMTAKQLSTTPHAFLSWSEAIRVAANKLN